MFDYYVHVNELPEDKLLEEIEKVNKKLFKAKSGPIQDQLMEMLKICQSAYQDIQYKRIIKSEDTVMEIGEMESTEETPDYTKKELLDIMVTSYTKDLKDKK